MNYIESKILTLKNMERLLHYVWKYKLYASTPLTTTEGLPIAVIDPGIQNTDAGPDFFNAKVKIDGTVWAEAWISTKSFRLVVYIIMIRIRHMTPLSCM